MKKGFFDTTALLSFFIRITYKTNTIKSVQCKTGASRSAGVHNKISRAYNRIKLMSAAYNSGDAKVHSIEGKLLNIKYAAFCNSLLVFASAKGLEQ